MKPHEFKPLTRKQKLEQGIPKPYKGNRKALYAEQLREGRLTVGRAILRDCPSSPRKMRLLADQIRGKQISYAISILSISTRHAARPLRKLLESAVGNYTQKYPEAEVPNLYVKTIFVDSASSLKRVRPAPQGRAYRVRKRSNHVTIILDQLAAKAA
jgi:large subunit ribosomal protein L22